MSHEELRWQLTLISCVCCVDRISPTSLANHWCVCCLPLPTPKASKVTHAHTLLGIHDDDHCNNRETMSQHGVTGLSLLLETPLIM